MLEVLAGVPTIVFGYFALTFFTPEVLRDALGLGVNQFNALSAGIILGILVVPTIASVAEDALSAVPQSLREGSAGLGANKVQTAVRVVFPAALSGVVAALVLGASRAVGETVIILIAGGQRANLSLNPYESYQSMAAFIAATARGDIPTDSIEYETIFVVAMTLFVLTLVAQPRLDPARPQVPAGVRMTGAQIAAAAPAGPSSRAPTARDRAFARVLPRAHVRRGRASAILALATLLFDIARDGLAGPLVRLPHQLPVADHPGELGHRVGDLGDALPDGHLRGDRRAARRRERRSTSRSTPTASSWWNRLVEVNIQNLAAVPSVVYGILGLAFIVRGPLSLGRTLLAGGITLALLVLPVVIIVSREAIRAVPPSIREGSLALGATQWQTIWKQVLPGSIAGIATGVILALSRAIGETAPLLVIGAAVNPRFNPDGLGSAFTALPIQIFAWTQDPNREFVDLAAGAIIVLMVVLLLMNSVAIVLRNRYEQKW